MKRKSEIVKDLSKNLIHHMMDKDSTGWPPNCAAFAYQPVRPCQKSVQDNWAEHAEKDSADIV